MRRTLLSLLAAAGLVAAAAPAARATIVERVVAVVGERPVFWTELLHRAAPARIQIRMQAADPNVVSVQEQEMYKELLQDLIDERLIEVQADKAHISVSPEEIDRGIANVAASASQQQGSPVTIQMLMDEVKHRGMSEQDFRDQVRRQILEGKLIELRVRPRVRVTEQDARASYQHWVQELREKQPVEVRVLPLRVNPPTQSVAQAKLALANEIVAKARAGADFCKLIAEYSDDVGTRGSCGTRGPQPLSQLYAPIQQAVKTLKPGTVSDPIPLQGAQDQVVVIVMPMGSAATPTYDSVQNNMMQRAQLEGLERARKQWLQELRQGVYIDVRL
jgi:peptidyl-prolyl cis-trans isomerase SurA